MNVSPEDIVALFNDGRHERVLTALLNAMLPEERHRLRRAFIVRAARHGSSAGALFRRIRALSTQQLGNTPIDLDTPDGALRAALLVVPRPPAERTVQRATAGGDRRGGRQSPPLSCRPSRVEGWET